MYKIGMLCKHFKGKNLLEKNIYRIEKLNVNGKEIDENLITYTGEKELNSAENLVIYSNIFQENKLFAREYEDISSELPYKKQETYQQQIKVQPLTQMEIDTINNPNFITEKTNFMKNKNTI